MGVLTPLVQNQFITPSTILKLMNCVVIPRVDIPESYLGQSQCIQNKQLMVQDNIEIFKYQIQTRAHQNRIHM